VLGPSGLAANQGDPPTQLRLEAGRIMEDTSSELATILPRDHAAIAAQLSEARQTGGDIQALLAAAQVLHRRCLDVRD
jgi:hypothetical protein